MINHCKGLYNWVSMVYREYNDHFGYITCVQALCRGLLPSYYMGNFFISHSKDPVIKQPGWLVESIRSFLFFFRIKNHELRLGRTPIVTRRWWKGLPPETTCVHVSTELIKVIGSVYGISTPWKINGWNLKIIQLNREHHLPNLHFVGS